MNQSLLFVDNVDSFTYNVVHLLSGAGFHVIVMRSDDSDLAPGLLENVSAVTIGPGPGKPSDFPRAQALARAAFEMGRPLFGVCLGLQMLGEMLGARVVHAPVQMHGKVSEIEHDGKGLFEGVHSPLRATRYHSLCLAKDSIPASLRVNACSADGVVQGIVHVERPLYAVQFHPESVLSEAGDAIAGNFARLVANRA